MEWSKLKVGQVHYSDSGWNGLQFQYVHDTNDNDSDDGNTITVVKEMGQKEMEKKLMP